MFGKQDEIEIASRHNCSEGDDAELKNQLLTASDNGDIGTVLYILNYEAASKVDNIINTRCACPNEDRNSPPVLLAALRGHQVVLQALIDEKPEMESLFGDDKKAKVGFKDEVKRQLNHEWSDIEKTSIKLQLETYRFISRLAKHKYPLASVILAVLIYKWRNTISNSLPELEEDYQDYKSQYNKNDHDSNLIELLKKNYKEKLQESMSLLLHKREDSKLTIDDYVEIGIKQIQEDGAELLKDIFEVPANIKVINAEGGFGKTTWTLYKVHQWSKGDLKDGDVKFIFWLSLKELIAYYSELKNKGKPISLAQIIAKLCLKQSYNSLEGRYFIEEIIQPLLSQANKGKAVFVLDGYDEVSQELEINKSGITDIFTSILDLTKIKHEIWITSRQYSFDTLKKNHLDKYTAKDPDFKIATFKMDHFSGESANQYIEKFYSSFGNNHDGLKEKMKGYISYNQNNLFKIPLFLQLACSIHLLKKEHSGNTVAEIPHVSLTRLYYESIAFLGLRFFEKNNLGGNPQTTVSEIYNNHHVQHVIGYMKFLIKNAAIDYDCIWLSKYAVQNKVNMTTLKEHVLSFNLVTGGVDSHYADLYFINSIFSDYFTNLNIADGVINRNGKLDDSLVEFTASKRGVDRSAYRGFFDKAKNSLRFVVGILAINAEYKALENLLGQIVKPIDEDNLAIAILCFEEILSEPDAYKENIKAIFNTVNQKAKEIIEAYIKKGIGSANLDQFSNALKSSPVFGKKILEAKDKARPYQDTLVSYLNKKNDEDMIDRTLIMLSNLRCSSQYYTENLLELLDDQKDNVVIIKSLIEIRPAQTLLEKKLYAGSHNQKTLFTLLQKLRCVDGSFIEGYLVQLEKNSLIALKIVFEVIQFINKTPELANFKEKLINTFLGMENKAPIIKPLELLGFFDRMQGMAFFKESIEEVITHSSDNYKVELLAALSSLSPDFFKKSTQLTVFMGSLFEYIKTINHNAVKKNGIQLIAKIKIQDTVKRLSWFSLDPATDIRAVVVEELVNIFENAALENKDKLSLTDTLLSLIKTEQSNDILENLISWFKSHQTAIEGKHDKTKISNILLIALDHSEKEGLIKTLTSLMLNRKISKSIIEILIKKLKHPKISKQFLIEQIEQFTHDEIAKTIVSDITIPTIIRVNNAHSEKILTAMLSASDKNKHQYLLEDDLAFIINNYDRKYLQTTSIVKNINRAKLLVAMVEKNLKKIKFSTDLLALLLIAFEHNDENFKKASAVIEAYHSEDKNNFITVVDSLIGHCGTEECNKNAQEVKNYFADTIFNKMAARLTFLTGSTPLYDYLAQKMTKGNGAQAHARSISFSDSDEIEFGYNENQDFELGALAKKIENNHFFVDNKNSSFENELNNNIALPESPTGEDSATSFEGLWDNSVDKHPETGEPVFTYRIFQKGKEVGSAEFYKHPLFCRSEDGTRHNLMALNGVLKGLVDLDLELAKAQEICQALPPSFWEKLSEQAMYGAASGGAQGLGNVANYACQRSGTSKTTGWLVGKSIYYFGIFGLSLNRHYARIAVPMEQDNDSSSFLTALYAASLETCQVAIMQIALAGSGQLLDYLGKEAQNHHHRTTAAGLTTVSKWLPYAIHAHRAITQGPLQTAASLITGSGSQILIESIGKVGVDTFFKASPQGSNQAKTATNQTINLNLGGS